MGMRNLKLMDAAVCGKLRVYKMTLFLNAVLKTK